MTRALFLALLLITALMYAMVGEGMLASWLFASSIARSFCFLGLILVTTGGVRAGVYHYRKLAGRQEALPNK
jgi:hypothetical protein